MARPVRRLRGAGAVLAAAAVLAGTGCSTVPRTGEVHEIGRVPGDDGDPFFERDLQVRKQPGGPKPGDPPVEVVRGFLEASADLSDDHAIARKFLVPQATWDTVTGTSVYRGRTIEAAVVKGARASVRVRFDRTGTVSPNGAFRPVADRPAVVLEMVRSASEWRIADPPAGLWLDEKDLHRSGATYHRVTTYFPDIARNYLVPDLLLLPADDHSLPRVALRALLDGPSDWLKPSVASAIPAGTEVLGTPTVSEGLLSVNFSRELRRAASEALPVVVAQIVWTLTDPELGVTSVRIDVEGEPITVAGRRLSRPQRRSDWPDLSPEPTPADARPFLVQNGQLVAVDEEGRTTPVWGERSLVAAAPSPSGLGAVGVRADGDGRFTLVVGELARQGTRAARASAHEFTPPSWEPDGSAAWTVAREGSRFEVMVVSVEPTVPLLRVRATLPPGTTAVNALRLSRDGVRVVLVLTVGGRRSLWHARVQSQADQSRSLTGLREIAPRLPDVRAVGWADASTLVVVAGTGPAAQLLRVDFDGYGLTAISVGGLPAALDGIADAPGLGLLVSGKGVVWRREPVGWRRLASGHSPVYAG